ncbi:hypothetical protein RFI_03589 [Reticulomyxa filosa]|uniref:Uncharacterized protein n=1 Tax=Reticulomyxa filosa TaxID=46433 RepID=X6P5W4_RETFI|nr:hypothetical protein RFI_03589 [Reticulomyxa filosa]|eukprot:ETO33513.1 hypothetical protein RFI_03589 [Reticulomyxa filosa]
MYDDFKFMTMEKIYNFKTKECQRKFCTKEQAIFVEYFIPCKTFFFVFSKVMSRPPFLEKIRNINMGNQNATPFQSLKNLLTLIFQSQWVLRKHKFLICGGNEQRACYSYHSFKNEYKFICEYPSHARLDGHCIVKLVDNNKDNNQITLLSFGGRCKHTLMVKYVSVWSNISNKLNKSNEFNNYNQWIPFTDNNNCTIIIGRDENHFIVECVQ